MKQIAEELGVGYVVEGSVRKGGDRVRITAQLNDVATGSHIWAERYDRESRRRVRGAGRDHRGHRRRDRAAALCRGEFSRPAQAARQHGRLGSGDAGAVALLAGDAAGQCGRAGAAGEGDRHRSELRPGARRARHQPYVQRPYGLGGLWQRSRRSPSARRWRRSWPTARTPGRITRWAASICSRGASTIRSPSSSVALRLNPNFSLAQGYYGLALSYCGRWEEADVAARRALRLSPARSVLGDLLRHRRLCPVRRAQLRRGDAACARGHPPARRFRRRPPRADGGRGHGRTAKTSLAQRCRNFAARSPTFRSPGSPSKCRSSRRRIEGALSGRLPPRRTGMILRRPRSLARPDARTGRRRWLADRDGRAYLSDVTAWC